jgi:hypothetical protein
MKRFILPFCFLLIVSCSERNQNNPFDSNGDVPVNLRIESINKSVELSWIGPNLIDYSGFNIYRKQDGVDQFFIRIAELPAKIRTYKDTTVEYGNKYIYFIKIASGNSESRPSDEKSVRPGPGFNWILDETAFTILKTSYDLSYIFLAYDTYPGRPTDMAVSNSLQTGVILYTRSGVVETIDFSGRRRNIYEGIRHPYAIAYDPNGALFWIADSSGILYTLNSQTDGIRVINSSLSKPISINIAATQNIISVVDAGSKEIVQFNRSGNIINTISLINGKPLEGPYRYVIDEQNDRSWLVDGNLNIDYIYTKSLDDEDYFLADSVINAGDIEINQSNALAWYISFSRDRSTVLQLSAEGTRQLELSYFFNPVDLQVNPHDGSLLVVDSWNGRVLHYDSSNNLIGEIRNLSFPVKVVVQ